MMATEPCVKFAEDEDLDMLLMGNEEEGSSAVDSSTGLAERPDDLLL